VSKKKKINLNFNINLSSKVKFVDKLVFTKHLAIMIKSGISLSEAVSTLALQSKGSPLGKVLKSVEKDIKNGGSLTDALKKFPKVFNNFYTSMIDIGEQAGTLEGNLNFLALHLNKEATLRKKVKGAMMYPGLVTVAMLIMSMLVSLYILPQFVDFFDAFQIDLPFTTRILLSIADFMKSYGILFFASLIFGFILLIIILNSKFVKPSWHKLVLKFPLFGNLIKYNQLTNFSRNFGVLLSSGITVTQSLEITGNTLSNLVYKTKIKRLNIALKNGENLSEAMEKEMGSQFPVLVTRMIAVGEKTGGLEETLLYLSEFYEEEIDVISKSLSTILEPMLLLGIGLMVGFVALAIITPIYELTGSIQR
jgi:type IV pilus assembly protein PilC